MKIYMAPMEGITGYVFRRNYARFYGDIDKYFSPFISPGAKRGLSGHDIRDIDPKNNRGISLIPQILSSDPDATIKCITYLNSEFGYDEFNLNFGCPSKTVVKKNKGAGILTDTQMLGVYLQKVCDAVTFKNRISIKSRVGFENEKEWENLMEIYNSFPISELIVHPRVGTDNYKPGIRYNAWKIALEKHKMPLIYNGDIYIAQDYEKLAEAFPETEDIMLGRGLVRDPSLAGKIRQNIQTQKSVSVTEKDSPQESGTERIVFGDFIRALSDDYQREYPDGNNALCRMKEIWEFTKPDTPRHERLIKSIKKAGNMREYSAYADMYLNVY